MVDINNMDKKIINNLSEGQSIEDIEKATNDKATIYYDETDGKAGFHDNDKKEIYINAGNRKCNRYRTIYNNIWT
jgi:hypothetical protein